MLSLEQAYPNGYYEVKFIQFTNLVKKNILECSSKIAKRFYLKYSVSNDSIIFSAAFPNIDIDQLKPMIDIFIEGYCAK